MTSNTGQPHASVPDELLVAGVDEAGRGPLAGPVAVAAVILDPAKLTRDRSKVMDALKKYFAMNRMALDVIPPGGLLLTCSCTGLVGEGEFLEMLRRVALNAGRTIQVLEVRGAGPDHPFRTDVPEGRYLKAVFCRVD